MPPPSCLTRSQHVPVQDLERLEFSAALADDGSFEASGLRRKEWPELILVVGVRSRCEEADARGDEGTTLAWYVPER